MFTLYYGRHVRTAPSGDGRGAVRRACGLRARHLGGPRDAEPGGAARRPRRGEALLHGEERPRGDQGLLIVFIIIIIH